ncbi:hypothetical protein [Nonlabens xiamenensis]|uniref:hypothetical protein n=1 Tax=Nonlabens xiamenensis TaxID=2341043 RepID=UPI000F60466F|nr:hypothetical protein [Nonlabens xiamenensis]
MNWNKLLFFWGKAMIIFSLLISIVATILSGITFSNNIHTLHSPSGWKYYFSLVGFLIFLMFFVLSLATLLALPSLKKIARKRLIISSTD